jgi:hypothetical protein
MTHADMGRHGARRDAAFYLTALEYGHYLWLQGHAGRALLALARGLYAEVGADDPLLRQWPLPYAALQWMIIQHPSDDFPGNPLLSFQHQAYRMPAPRQWQRCARAWAVWALILRSRPSLTSDPALPCPAPTAIFHLLQQFGHPGEAEQWAERIALPLPSPAATYPPTPAAHFHIAAAAKHT